MTVLGVVCVRRAYYHCKHCHAGHCPRDTALGVTAVCLSRGANEAVALAGVLSSFAEAAQKTLPKLAGLAVSESTVERTTERVGQDVGQRLAEGQTFGESKVWKWSKDTDFQSVAYVSADATGVGMQGEGGTSTEGRMASVGMVWNAEKPGQVRYVCGLVGGLKALGQSLRNQAAQVGMDKAQRWVAISDGGVGMEDFLRENFPRVEAVILDFYHVAEYLCEWSKALHPDEDEAKRVAQAWCHQLKHEGGKVVLAELKRINVLGRSAVVQEAHRVLLVYFTNQVHRMDYPGYRAKGWLIGSGPVEAACKQVIGQRMKGCGMRWGQEGADAVCHLRALFRSEKTQWNDYWASLAA